MAQWTGTVGKALQGTILFRSSFPPQPLRTPASWESGEGTFPEGPSCSAGHLGTSNNEAGDELLLPGGTEATSLGEIPRAWQVSGGKILSPRPPLGSVEDSRLGPG